MTYYSRGIKISKSLYHRDLWLFEKDGKWWAVNSTDALMEKLHPKDNELIVSNAQPHRTEDEKTH